MRKLSFLGICVAALLSATVFSAVEAAPPGFLAKLGGQKKVEADPNKEYKLVDTNGPWLIQVTSFSGPNARHEANNLVHELRSKYNYNAYVYDKVFTNDLSQEKEKPRGLISHKKTRYLKTGTRQDFIVLIGDFQSMDDLDFQKALKEIKTMHPESYRRGGTMSMTQWQQGGVATPNNARGPFHVTAMGTRNPMMPPENQPGTIDKFLTDLNSKRKYSLLTCPGLYTVRVATFTGRTIIRQDEIKEIEEGKRQFSNRKVSELELSERAAVKLCEILRQKGFEAYEFHDYHASYVTVGSFNSVGQPRPDGKTEINPDIYRVMEYFKGTEANNIGQGTISHEPKRFDDIECDVQPLIIPVPRPK